MVIGASGQPSADSRTAKGSAQILAATFTVPLLGGPFFAWPKARVAITRHRHNCIFLINVPLFCWTKPLCRSFPKTESAFVWRAHCVAQARAWSILKRSMPVFICMLRGVNVGGHNMIKMDALK